MQNINDEFGMLCRSWQMNFWKFFNDENWELYWNFLAVKYSPENYKTKMDSRVRSDGVRPKIKNPEDERVNFFLANFTKFDIWNVFVRPGGIILSS